MKKILIDTNIISDWVKGVLEVNLEKFNNSIIYLPALSLVEIYKFRNLLLELLNLSKIIDIRILKPSNILCTEEKRIVENDHVIEIELLDLHHEVLHNHIEIKNYFISDTFKDLVEILERNEKVGRENVKKKINDNDYTNIEDFAESYLFTQISMNDPEFMKRILETNRIGEVYKIKSVLLQGYFIYEKYINKKIVVNDSDIFDAMIIAALPYVDIFYTERQNCGILKDIRRKMDFLMNKEIFNYKEFKRFAT